MPTSDPYLHRRRPALALIAWTLGLASALAPVAGAAQVEAPAAGAEPGPAAAGPTPFVVAVDTSRSLAPAELEAAVAALRSALAALSADTPTGLVAFDDRPRWVRPVGASPTAVSEALGALVPAGRFTQLHDGLFAAVRALPDGGVVLVATDGRDESSATTVDDIARRCEDQGVRLLTLGAGAPVEERGLRRLALISDGAYLGTAAAVEPSALVEAVSRAREGVAERRAEERAAAEAARAAGAGAGRPGAGGPAAGEGGSRGGAGAGEAGEPGAAGGRAAERDGGLLGVPWWLVAAVLVLLALALLALLLAARRRSAREAAATAEAEHEVADAVAAQRHETRPIPASLVDTLTARAAAPAGSAEEVSVDTAVFGGSNGDATLDQTRVLAQRALLTVKEPGEGPPRTFLLRTDAAFAIGRDRRRNTLAVPDPALSSQHFKIVPDEGRFFLLDLRSTNGTFVNGERAQVHELESGDQIHAGQLECSFRSFAQAMG
jgi:hypothetical protein